MSAELNDLLALLALFQKHNVRYLIVGGLAVNRYGHHRSTGDVDIYLQDLPQNRKNLVAAFEEAGFGRLDPLLTTQIVAGYCEVLLNDGLYADLMTEIPGLSPADFDRHYAAAVTEEVNGIAVRFIGYADLLRNKLATARPKDLLDVQELQKINPPHGTDPSR